MTNQLNNILNEVFSSKEAAFNKYQGERFKIYVNHTDSFDTITLYLREFRLNEMTCFKYCLTSTGEPSQDDINAATRFLNKQSARTLSPRETGLS